MQVVSEAYLEEAAKKSRRFFVRLYFPALDMYVYEENIWSGSYNDAVDVNSILSMGNACAKKVELTLHGISSATIWKGAEFTIECGLKVPEEGIVYVPWGRFWVTDTSTSNNHRTVKLTAYDRMYSLSKLQYVTSLGTNFHYRDLLHEFLTKTGLTLSEASVEKLPDPEDDTYVIASFPDMDFKWSDIAGHLAGMLGCNARISVADSNVLEFVWYEATGTIIERTLYQDGLEKLSDGLLSIEFLVTGENGEIEIENDDPDDDQGEIDFSEFDTPNAEDLPMFTFTFDAETATASVRLTDGLENNTDALVIPGKVRYNGVVYTVTSVDAEGFEYSAAESITLPTTILTIGTYAFKDCKFETMTVPASVTSIGGGGFYQCTNLKQLYWNAISSTAGTAQFSAFSGCSSLVFVQIAENVKTIPANFLEKTPVIMVTIPRSVESVGGGAFAQCPNLTHLYWNPVAVSSCGTVSSAAFRSCPSLEYVIFPDDIEIIPANIANNSAVKSITIPAGVKSIGAFAFADCTQMTTIYWNAVNCTSVGTSFYSALGNCTAMSEFVIAPFVESLPKKMLYNGVTALTSVDIPASVKSIGSNSFSGCSNLATITVHNIAGSISGSPWGATNATIIWAG